ncbi:MAG: cytidylate kinase-like family protein [Firmicutes bacterium]|nr:cytidylate kinase-like family protein [Bacillota bacterium]
MDNFYAITIARQFCSGGNAVGEMLAEKLGINMYDKQLITMAAKKSGYHEAVFEQADEVASNSLLYSVVMGSSPMGSLLFPNNNLVTNDSLFTLQSNIIKETAEKESCIVIGRCSNYVLRKHPRLLSVYLWADLDYRIKRYEELYGEPKEKDIETELSKADKKRRNYYNYYSGKDWDSATSYDLVINVSKAGVEGTVKQIIDFKEMLGY